MPDSRLFGPLFPDFIFFGSLIFDFRFFGSLYFLIFDFRPLCPVPTFSRPIIMFYIFHMIEKNIY